LHWAPVSPLASLKSSAGNDARLRVAALGCIAQFGVPCRHAFSVYPGDSWRDLLRSRPVRTVWWRPRSRPTAARERCVAAAVDPLVSIGANEHGVNALVSRGRALSHRSSSESPTADLLLLRKRLARLHASLLRRVQSCNPLCHEHRRRLPSQESHARRSPTAQARLPYLDSPPSKLKASSPKAWANMATPS